MPYPRKLVRHRKLPLKLGKIDKIEHLENYRLPSKNLLYPVPRTTPKAHNYQ
jgi:hypothetical protein